MSFEKPKLLLHVCCAPCSTYPIRVLQEDYDVELFFYNPNIHPEEEYKARADEACRYAKGAGIELHEAAYEVDRWFACMKGLEDAPEGGRRCEACYEMRLSRAADFASTHGFGYFTTTLSISPHKNSGVINKIGRKIAEGASASFYAADFKKHDGFKKASQISKESGLYRQNYCGCIYSRKG